MSYGKKRDLLRISSYLTGILQEFAAFLYMHRGEINSPSSPLLESSLSARGLH